jgi:hypothetical protein
LCNHSLDTLLQSDGSAITVDIVRKVG